MLKSILYIDGVIDIEDKHFWGLSTGYLVCTLKIKIRKDANGEFI